MLIGLSQTLSAYSKFIVRTLRINNAHIGASIHMFLVFFISGVFHALPLRVMLGKERRLPLGTIFFFSSQVVGIFIEETVIEVYGRVCGNVGTLSWYRWVGFLWVATWFYLTLPFFLDNMFESGLMDASTMPFSVVRAVAGSFGWPLKV